MKENPEMKRENTKLAAQLQVHIAYRYHFKGSSWRIVYSDEDWISQKVQTEFSIILYDFVS